MSVRRLFSKNITTSARFIKMPEGAQNLYWHLCQHADDDGIVEGFTVMKMLGTNDDNVAVLQAKNFVKILSPDDCITFITDWHEHNKIRADRKVDSIYQGLLLQILPEIKPKLVVPKIRVDTGALPRQVAGRQVDSNWTATGHPLKNTLKNKEKITGQQLDSNWTDTGQPLVALREDKISEDNIRKDIGDGLANAKPEQGEGNEDTTKPLIASLPPEKSYMDMSSDEKTAYMNKYHPNETHTIQEEKALD